jgi:hypothetical protein
VTCFILHLKERLLQPTFFKQLLQLGFLAGWESLLSTYKTELGMLEDCSAAVNEVNRVLRFKVSGDVVGEVVCCVGNDEWSL